MAVHRTYLAGARRDYLIYVLQSATSVANIYTDVPARIPALQMLNVLHQPSGANGHPIRIIPLILIFFFLLNFHAYLLHSGTAEPDK